MSRGHLYQLEVFSGGGPRAELHARRGQPPSLAVRGEIIGAWPSWRPRSARSSHADATCVSLSVAGESLKDPENKRIFDEVERAELELAGSGRAHVLRARRQHETTSPIIFCPGPGRFQPSLRRHPLRNLRARAGGAGGGAEEGSAGFRLPLRRHSGRRAGIPVSRPLPLARLRLQELHQVRCSGARAAVRRAEDVRGERGRARRGRLPGREASQKDPLRGRIPGDPPEACPRRALRRGSPGPRRQRRGSPGRARRSPRPSIERVASARFSWTTSRANCPRKAGTNCAGCGRPARRWPKWSTPC